MPAKKECKRGLQTPGNNPGKLRQAILHGLGKPLIIKFGYGIRGHPSGFLNRRMPCTAPQRKGARKCTSAGLRMKDGAFMNEDSEP